MAPTAQTYSPRDLFLMILGLRVLENEPTDLPNDPIGSQYWLDDGSTRELKWNGAWFGDPEGEFAKVRFREWLVAAQAMRSVRTQFVAVPDPPKASIDVSSQEIDPATADDLGNTALIELTTPKGSSEHRSFCSAVSVGVHTEHVPNGPPTGEEEVPNVATIGLGFRTRTKVAPSSDFADALQLDIECYAPLQARTLDDGNTTSVPETQRSLRFALALTRQGNALDTAGGFLGDQIGALRVSAQIPLSEADATLGTPVAKVETRGLADVDGNYPPWQEKDALDDWLEPAINSLVSGSGVPGSLSMLSLPICPLTLEEVSWYSIVGMITGAVQLGAKTKVKTDREELDDSFQDASATANWLRKLARNGGTIPPNTPLEPTVVVQPSGAPTQQGFTSVGNVLATLGLLSATDPTPDLDDSKTIYGLTRWKDLQELDVFTVLNRLIGFMDGVPFLFSLQKISASSQPSGSPMAFGPTRKALQFASVGVAGTDEVHYFGARLRAYDVDLYPGEDTPPSQVTYRIAGQLGKWFDGEGQDDNWLRRLLPTQHVGSGRPTKPPVGFPGLGGYPLRVRIENGDPVEAEWAGRFDLVSAGADWKSATWSGLIEHPRFRVGGVEARLTFAASTEEAWQNPLFETGFGVRLNDVRLSLAPATTDSKTADSDIEASILSGVQGLFAEADADATSAPAVPPTDLFGISVGYLWPLNTFDLQLWDSSGARGGVAWIPIQRGIGGLQLEKLGISVRGVENQAPRLALLLQGRMQIGTVELELMGGGVSFPMGDPTDLSAVLLGLGFSFPAGPAYVRGGFLKRQGPVYLPGGGLKYDGDVAETVTQFAGEVSIQLPSFSLAAMGSYGRLQDGASTLFLYGALTAGKAGGIGNAVLKLTGLALGFGINRRVVPPLVSQVGTFPMVEMVMGPGGLPSYADLRTDARDKLSQGGVEPAAVLARMVDSLRVEEGQYFGCLGLRFTLVDAIDAFGLAIVQGGNDFSITLLGLGRLKEPKVGTPICYAELAIRASIDIEAVGLTAQAVLTPNSWVIEPSCQLTGGFALAFWGSGPHKGDFVVSLGGYHPAFPRPAHYPQVPRLGINWPLSSQMLVKGGMYCAVTPSAIMAGGTLEASFRAGRLSAWFTAEAHFLMEWQPTHYDISVAVELGFSLCLSLRTVTLSAQVMALIKGPPVYFEIEISCGPIHFQHTEGSPPKSDPTLIDVWAAFGPMFIGQGGGTDDDEPDSWQPLADGETQKPGPTVQTPVTLAGRQESPGNADYQENPPTGAAPAVQKLRADEAVFRVNTRVPVTELEVWTGGDLAVANLPAAATPGEALTIATPIVASPTDDRRTVLQGSAVGVRPMGVSNLASTLRVAVIREVDERTLSLDGWDIGEDRSAMPAAVWDTEVPDLSSTPSLAPKIVDGCLVGLSRLAPPAGHCDGMRIGPLSSTLFRDEADELADILVEPVALAQEALRRATAAEESLADGSDLDTLSPQDRAGLLAAMRRAGFALDGVDATPPHRTLRARPLAGAVADRA